jgi:hypothetical protein
MYRLGYKMGKDGRSLRRRGAWRFHSEELPRKEVESLVYQKGIESADTAGRIYIYIYIYILMFIYIYLQ